MVLNTPSTDLLTVIVLFKPDKQSFITIEEVLTKQRKLFLWINACSDEQKEYILNLGRNYPNLEFNFAPCNEGLGVSLHDVGQHAVSKGYKFLLLLDQDTILSEKFFSNLDLLPVNQWFKEDLLCLQILSRHDRRFKHDSIDISRVNFVINSGSIIDLQKSEKIGFHSKDFFVECVDYEYCMRSRAFGYKVGVLNGFGELDHHSAQDGDSFRLYSLKFQYRVYGKERARDFYSAHARLFRYAIVNNMRDDLMFLVTSLMKFFLGQILNKLKRIIHNASS